MPLRAGEGTFTPSSPFKLDVDVSDVRIVIADTVKTARWAISTSPEGCALASVSEHEIRNAERKNKCYVEWTVALPALDDVTIDVSVGDIDVIAPSDRAVQLRTSVGEVRVRLDHRLVQHDNAPGSGDRWTIGDMASRPRLNAKVDVGAVRLELRTAAKAP